MSTREDAQKLLAGATRTRAARRSRANRTLEFVLLLVASLIVGMGFWLVYQAKSAELRRRRRKLSTSIHSTTPINCSRSLNEIADADRTADPPPAAYPGLRPPRQHPQRRRDCPSSAGGRAGTATLPLLTGTQIRNLKPLLIVRTPGAWRNSVILWTAVFFLCFFGLHLFWRYAQFAGDNLILPAIELLCGAGLILMISLRDPLRDTLMFRDFAQGILGGSIVMAAMSLPDYYAPFPPLHLHLHRRHRRCSASALATLGSGPGGSDAKVNLFFFQPVEVMRVLIVFFVAGYFAAELGPPPRPAAKERTPLRAASTSRASTTSCPSRSA